MRCRTKKNSRTLIDSRFMNYNFYRRYFTFQLLRLSIEKKSQNRDHRESITLSRKITTPRAKVFFRRRCSSPRDEFIRRDEKRPATDLLSSSRGSISRAAAFARANCAAARVIQVRERGVSVDIKLFLNG